MYKKINQLYNLKIFTSGLLNEVFFFGGLVGTLDFSDSSI